MNRALFLTLFLFPCLLFAQWSDTSDYREEDGYMGQWQVEERLEQYAESGGDVPDGSDLQDALEELRAHPVNLHLADDACLGGLLGLTEFQRYQLRRYIFLHGHVQTPQELAAVEGFSESVVRRIMPYVTFGKPPERKPVRLNRLASGKSSCLLRWGRVLEPQQGYRRVPDSIRALSPGSLYEGSADALLLKYSYRCTEGINAGFVAEKDAGESFFRASNPHGFDYFSGYVQYQGKGCIRRLVAGDYQLQFGQALAMGMGFRPRNADPGTVCDAAYGLKAHTAANENQFFRGAALTFGCWKWMEATLFLSMCHADAVLSDSAYTSRSVTGYHRTASEIAKEDAAREFSAGCYLVRNGRSMHVGAGCYLLREAMPLLPSDKTYARFRFSGGSLWNGSTDFTWNLGHTTLFGELACSGNGSAAFIGGAVCEAQECLRFSLLLRLLPKDYQAIPDVLDGSYDLSNVQSLQLCCRMLLGKRGTLDADLSYCRYPWLRYQTDAPSQGSALRLRFCTTDHAGGAWLLLYRWNRKEGNCQDDALRIIQPDDLHASRVRWEWKPVERWRIRLQWDGALYGGADSWSKGGMWSQQLSCSLRKIRYSLSFACFDTDSYQAALYLSEQDVRYATSVVSCSGRGVRLYGLVTWRLSAAWSMQAKLTCCCYADRDAVGSGATQIDKPHKTEIRLQWIWKG